jgi:iron complex transport system permease protein
MVSRIITEETRNYPAKFAVLGGILLVVTAVSFCLGRYATTPWQFVEIIRADFTHRVPDVPRDVQMVFFRIRIPRVLIAMLAGAGLSVSGCAYQGVFRNPMVSPDILGATAGAGFGASIAILLGLGDIGVQTAAFGTGLAAVLITYTLGMMVSSRGNVILPLVLSGIVVAALFRAGISMIKTTADPFNKLPAITFWLLGSLGAVKTRDILWLFLPLLIGTVPLVFLGWRINLLSFGDEEAAAMGVNPSRIRGIVIICSSMITSAVVSIGGLIEWVGLVIPHLARMIVGPDYKALIPATLLLGGAFLLLVDDVARSLLASEISLGILTALIGAPFFVFLLYKEKRRYDRT